MSIDPSSSIYKLRLAKLAEVLPTSRVEVLALNSGPSLSYLSGLHFHLSERPELLIFVPGKPLVIVLPELEAGKVNNLDIPIQSFPYKEDPDTWITAFKQAVAFAGIDGLKIGLEPRRFRLLELRLLEVAAPRSKFLSGEDTIASLRMYKDISEISAMQNAVDIAQAALKATLPLVKVGMTERELASEITLQLLRHGSDPQLPFSPIVASGPNSANPHATPTDRSLEDGDMLILDWGASFKGYISDLTRTFVMGEPDQKMVQVARIVEEANSAARHQALPGTPAGEVDSAARSIIEAAGYGENFVHRTGHGIGLESHEEPYIRSDNQLPLENGMTFTIEPGIYLPGQWGVRIEDDIQIASTGGKSLSNLPRRLQNL
jgi:Xaa-Pro dipeptidase